MAFCTKCGAQISDGAAFCTSCGQPTSNAEKKQGGSDGRIPTFTPPTPTFTPPSDAKPTFNGPACYYHSDEPAVAQCARCGKYICQDCYDNYGVSGGEYQGHALCYDCCQQLVAENIADLKKNKNKIKFQFILSIIGMVIGFILGMSAGIESGDIGSGFVSGLIFACVGGVFLSALKAFFSLLWDAIKIAFAGQFGILTILSIIFQTIVIVFKCIWVTISNTFYYIKYLRETSGFIESDTAALQQMKDYMEYTLVRNQNRGVDIETLLNQKSELADNSYARMVQEKGEEGAEAALRDCVATINENGEIIRSFNNRAA